MARSPFRLGILMLITGLVVGSGCETLGHRKSSSSGEKEETSKDKEELDIHSIKADGTKSFYKNRRPGLLSDEAREIESHFNIQ